MTASNSAPVDEPALYSTYELDFMLSLRENDGSRASREQIGILGVPEEAEEFVREAVMAGLRARGRIHHDGSEWVLGEEAQVIATVLSAADRWLGIALAQGDAMRGAFVVKANEAVLMLTQDELESFRIVSLGAPGTVGRNVADIAAAFLGQGPGRTVSLRCTDARDLATAVPMMLHVEDDGSWHVGHLPMTEEGTLSVSPTKPQDLQALIEGLWNDGVSAARR
ncbi:hypothetical protein Bequi_06645 [Brachybacterium sp. JHP9]|uniref:ESAT-6 protein secretion system EspG family protein n=1 Tax=Brachybacterium equifaecis TaxID=2910770 RepID=A0ABT0QZL2_9MICO|nr:hypothetical protein [Brachybacterium equifaecis]MCL6423066.1 hypothetical protein [Brachybacterium equifaecis]